MLTLGSPQETWNAKVHELKKLFGDQFSGDYCTIPRIRIAESALEFVPYQLWWEVHNLGRCSCGPRSREPQSAGLELLDVALSHPEAIRQMDGVLTPFWKPAGIEVHHSSQIGASYTGRQGRTISIPSRNEYWDSSLSIRWSVNASGMGSLTLARDCHLGGDSTVSPTIVELLR